MKILVIGSGGREHAIIQTIREAGGGHELFAAPGNAGTMNDGRNVSISAEDVDALTRFSVDEEMDLVIVGPEAPLVLGIADRLIDAGVPVVGPTAAAARLEGSKSFAKDFMRRHGIPTADYRTFRRDEYESAVAHVRSGGLPVVVKASGLAAGKGAIVCDTEAEALEAIRSLLVDGALGRASEEIVLESFMEGEEASLFVVTDGEDYVLLPSAQDHKRIGDGDTGPNTGGMGAYAPAPVMTPELVRTTVRSIVEPTLEGMRAEGHPYTGILYCGLMVTGDSPKVVEFNCRLGDPEAQAVLPLLSTDPAELFRRAASGTLKDFPVEVADGAAASVVMASAGYPGPYEKGKTIRGIGEAVSMAGVRVYFAGVQASNGDPTTSGGRVLAVTGLGADLSVALDRAYAGVRYISFDGCYFRSDIGEKGLARMEVR